MRSDKHVDNIFFHSAESDRFSEIATRLEGTVVKERLKIEGLEVSIGTLGEELERVRKQEAWVSEQRKKEGSDLASKIDDLWEECNEAAEERDTAEGMLRTRNEVIE